MRYVRCGELPGLPLRSFTYQLRERYPEEARRLRLKRVNRPGREVFQLIGTLPDKTPVGRTLKAANEFNALQEAIELVPLLMSGGDRNLRMVPMGQMRLMERRALQLIEESGLRPSTEQYKSREVKWITSWLEERGLPLQTATLLSAIKSTDQAKRKRRGVIEGARVLAKVANLPLEVDPSLLYKEPTVPLVEAVSDDKIIEAYDELMSNSNRPEVTWIIGVIIATGCRAATTLSMEVKGVKDVGDQILAWDSKNDRQIRTMPTIRGFWQKYYLDQRPLLDDLKEFAMPCDRRPTDEQVQRANSFINECFTHVKRKVSPEHGETLKARVLRSACVARLLLAGIDEMTVSSLTSTGVDQIRARYSRYYKSTSIQRAAELL